DNSWSFVPVRSPITPYGIVIETGFVRVMTFGTRAGLAGVTATGDFKGADLAPSERDGWAPARAVGIGLLDFFRRWSKTSVRSLCFRKSLSRRPLSTMFALSQTTIPITTTAAII